MPQQAVIFKQSLYSTLIEQPRKVGADSAAHKGILQEVHDERIRIENTLEYFLEVKLFGTDFKYLIGYFIDPFSISTYKNEPNIGFGVFVLKFVTLL